MELYQGSKKLGSYASSLSKTTNADLRSDPSLYTVEMRIRGNKVRVYSGAAYTLRLQQPLLQKPDMWIHGGEGSGV